MVCLGEWFGLKVDIAIFDHIGMWYCKGMGLTRKRYPWRSMIIVDAL